MQPINQCQGQAYDGAANMSGHINGVAARIQEVKPRAIYVHCLANCTNLSLQQVGRQVLCMHEALNLVMELSHFIQNSTKRSGLFESIMAMQCCYHSQAIMSNTLDSTNTGSGCSLKITA